MLIRWFLPAFAFMFLTIPCCRAAEPAPASAIPSRPLPDGLGVNVHFTDPRPGEMEMLNAGGFTWVRMDLNWGSIERKRGVYDFAAYDRLMAALDSHGMKAMFILDYSNRNYDNDLSPHTDEGRAAFAAWAVAAVRHFKGRGILWEMYNEPNGIFWKPQENPEAYAKLALDVGKAIRAAEPGETYIGPATSTIDLKFMEACFKAGLLEYWAAVSCHPYRQTEPETVASQYRQLRLLIARYAPRGKQIPIISGEWGYSTAWSGQNDEKQGQYLPRQWLINQWQEVPLSIWYDWHEDGPDPKEAEHHFGIVRHPYQKDATPIYEPKPAYLAAKTLAAQLAGYRFNKRLMMDKPEDFVLLFDKAGQQQDEVRLAVWTTAKEPHAVKIPASAGEFAVTSHLGEKLPNVIADAKGLTVTLSAGPQYLAPLKPNELLLVAASYSRLPLEIAIRAPGKFAISSSGRFLGKDPKGASAVGIAGDGSVKERSDRPITETLTCDLLDSPTHNGPRIILQTEVIVINPLRVTLMPRSPSMLAVKVEDVSGEGFHGTISPDGIAGLDIDPKSALPLDIKPGQFEQTVQFPVRSAGNADYSVGFKVKDDQDRAALDVARVTMVGITDFAIDANGTHTDAWKLHVDGNAKVPSEQALTVEPPPDAAPDAGMGVLKIAYKTERGWKFWRIEPKAELRKIEGEPRAYGLWIYGDGKGALPRIRFTDSTGQTFQPSAEAIKWNGWRYVTFPMQGASLAGSHWGGANDGVIHYPIHWDSIFLLDRDQNRAAQGAIYISGPTLVR